MMGYPPAWPLFRRYGPTGAIKGAGLILLLAVLAGPPCQRPAHGQSGGDASPARHLGDSPSGRGRSEPILPVRIPRDLDQGKVELGELLFNDSGLSKDGSIACVSCHDLATGGTDRLATSRGIGGSVLARNAPTVFNSGLNFRQFWDGRAATLEEQIEASLRNPTGMAAEWPEVLARLRGDSDYAAAFERVYDDGVQAANVKDAIATFQRSLATPGARFDRFLLGEDDAITDEEKAGYELFKSFGCVACHQGVNVGGNMFQKIGVFKDYTSRGEAAGDHDDGRFHVTGRESDRRVFKVPSFRNVAITAPYFHDGSVKKLQQAVALMASYQLGRDLSADEIQKVVAFLRTLTGNLRGSPL